MGRYARLYVGPYATCEEQATRKVVQVRGCPATMCQKPKPTREIHSVTSDFCSSCGCRNVPLDITVESWPSPFDALSSERLSAVQPEGIAHGTVYFICNEGGAAARKFIIEPESHVGLDGFHVEHETRWFEERYAVELAQLKLYYGNCTIRWGVHYFAR